METFKIEIQEQLARVVEVCSDNLNNAFAIIKEQYDKAEIVLDYNDFVAVEFIDINDDDIKGEINLLVKDIIEYLYKDEQKHFEELGSPDDHIFLKINRLKNIIE